MIYEFVSWFERNPLFGAVFTWAGAAIIANSMEKENSFVTMGAGAIWVIHVLDQIILIMYLMYEEFQPNF